MNNYFSLSTDEPPKVFILPERFKIKYAFKLMMKGASIDIYLLADVDYIEARFEELKLCYQQLAKKVGEINIVSGSGANDFDIANSLVSYYRLSAVALHNKRKCLLRVDVPLTELELKQIEEGREAFEKSMYTGTLRQGK